MNKCWEIPTITLNSTGILNFKRGTLRKRKCEYSVILLCPTLHDSMSCSKPGFPVLRYLPEFAQALVHWVDDAFQPSHPLVLSLSSFPSCPQSFPASGSFPMSWLFTSGGQSIGTSASALPMNSQDWFYLGLTGLISLLFKGLSRVFLCTTIQKHQFCSAQPRLCPTLTPVHDYWKHQRFDHSDFCQQNNVSAF